VRLKLLTELQLRSCNSTATAGSASRQIAVQFKKRTATAQFGQFPTASRIVGQKLSAALEFVSGRRAKIPPTLSLRVNSADHVVLQSGSKRATE